ncbi:GIY-YIG nuclease family protein [Paenibacillus ginsengarvi]|uniref:GIY-YIG nuclease family protein n=1 Tax=Paenibacillus ginsengarvi TaxID=400777 RepID=A0A3B0C3E1_9BACL|nr:GIY-YIG nuclease family protein [Paenibacillus ginsengarvi]RKN78924.1 GIY-YIG nuclease family protein [Paenibacillus ginsengarvi]
MNRRKELVEQYKEMKTEAGVYQFRNTANGKVWITSTNNFRSINGKRMMLDMGSHPCKELQADWKQHGADAFVIEILEQLKQNDNESVYYDLKKELRKLEDKWMEQIRPFGERGYHGPEVNGAEQ